MKWSFINRHWAWCQLILAIRTTNERPARSQSFSNFPYKGKYEASKTTQNGPVLTHHPLWTCHGTFVSQMSSYIHFHAPPHLILLQRRKMVVWCCILLTHRFHSDAQSDFKSIFFKHEYDTFSFRDIFQFSILVENGGSQNDKWLISHFTFHYLYLKYQKPPWIWNIHTKCPVMVNGAF